MNGPFDHPFHVGSQFDLFGVGQHLGFPIIYLSCRAKMPIRIPGIEHLFDLCYKGH